MDTGYHQNQCKATMQKISGEPRRIPLSNPIVLVGWWLQSYTLHYVIRICHIIYVVSYHTNILCIYIYLETPCRKIFDTRVFSGKKGNKGYKKMTFQEKRYKAKMQHTWYIKKSCYVAKLLSGNFQHPRFLAQFREFLVQKHRWAAKGSIEGWLQLNYSPDHWIWKKTTFRVEKAQFGKTWFFPLCLFFAYFGVTRKNIYFKILCKANATRCFFTPQVALSAPRKLVSSEQSRWDVRVLRSNSQAPAG